MLRKLYSTSSGALKRNSFGFFCGTLDSEARLPALFKVPRGMTGTATRGIRAISFKS